MYICEILLFPIHYAKFDAPNCTASLKQMSAQFVTWASNMMQSV